MRTQIEALLAQRHLQNKLAEVRILGEVGDLGADVVGVDRHRFVLAVGGRERYFVQQFFHYRVEPPRADVLDRAFHLGGEIAPARRWPLP